MIWPNWLDRMMMMFAHNYLPEGVVLEKFCRTQGVIVSSSLVVLLLLRVHVCFGGVIVSFFFQLCASLVS
jgi:hypothetical protein